MNKRLQKIFQAIRWYTVGMSREDRRRLRAAGLVLERSSFLMLVADNAKLPVEALSKIIPAKDREKVKNWLVRHSHKAVDFLVNPFESPEETPPREKRYRWLSTLSGAATGVFGLPGALVDIPVTYMMALKTVINVACQYGEDLTCLENRLACLEVLAVSGSLTEERDKIGAYFKVRAIMAVRLRSAEKALLNSAAGKQLTQLLVKTVSQMLSRFGVVLTEKLVLQSMVVIGGIAGAAINHAFMKHIEETARAHFTIRQLERKYGAERIQRKIQKLQFA
ncbi:MAG: EcsC family protein [Calditrichia bacterium]